MSNLNSRSHVPRWVPPRAVFPRAAGIISSECQGAPLSVAESFDKGDSAGWDFDQEWSALPTGYSGEFANVATQDGCAIVAHPAACSGNGEFHSSAGAMVPTTMLLPDQIVEVTFVDQITTWTGGGEYDGRIDVLARACELDTGTAFYSAGVIAPTSPGGALAVIQKIGNGTGETLAQVAHTLTPGDVLRLEAIGNTLVFKINGSTLLSVSGDTQNGPNTGPALYPSCSSAGLGLVIVCVDVTAGGQGPFGGAGGWSTIKADNFSVVASS